MSQHGHFIWSAFNQKAENSWAKIVWLRPKYQSTVDTVCLTQMSNDIGTNINKYLAQISICVRVSGTLGKKVTNVRPQRTILKWDSELWTCLWTASELFWFYSSKHSRSGVLQLFVSANSNFESKAVWPPKKGNKRCSSSSSSRWHHYTDAP